MPSTRWIAGCMTGTSLDGLDVALAEIEGTGLDMKATFRGMVSRPLGDLAKKLRHFAEGEAAPPIDYLRAARELGELHADAVEELCKKHLQNRTNSTDLNNIDQSPPTPVGGLSAPPKLDFIVAHGQTIWHAPTEGLSWQLFDPWPLVRRLRVPVCYDLRQADLIAGGQGAPITPIADWILYRDNIRRTVIANLGGICNITILQPGRDASWITGGDIGPCNLLIDGVVRELFPSLRFDVDGAIAARGGISDEFLLWFREAPFFSRPWPRSTGREDFDRDWVKSLIDRARARFPGWPAENIVACAVHAVADMLAFHDAARPGGRIVLAGGGVKNPVLLKHIHALTSGSDIDVLISDDFGIPCEAREALAFAILGALSQDGVPITLPKVTGSTNPGRAGAWVYP